MVFALAPLIVTLRVLVAATLFALVRRIFVVTRTVALFFAAL
jgi:hypothetical protein